MKQKCYECSCEDLTVTPNDFECNRCGGTFVHAVEYDDLTKLEEKNNGKIY